MSGRSMKVIPLAFDSLGTRSMSTFVETKDVKILIDPACDLAPKRFGLPPHPLEEKRLKEHWANITRHAKASDILIITHYHYDHHSPEKNTAIYKNKTVLVKHPTEKINASQKARASLFLGKIRKTAREVKYSDGEKMKFGKTVLEFSPPVFHGKDSKLGYVTEVFIDDGYRFLYTSDVEGCNVKEQTDFILEKEPNLLIMDGPLTSLLGFKYSYDDLNGAVKNLIEIVKTCPLDAMIIDHHLLRDLKWKERIGKVFEQARKRNIKIQTAAEFMGEPIDMLEAHRRELYKKQPVV